MPVSRLHTEALAESIAAIYADAEYRLLQLIARHLSNGGEDVPDWAEQKLQDLQVLRRRAQTVVAVARGEAVDATGQALARAYLRGAASATAEAESLLGKRLDAPVGLAEEAVSAMARAMADQLESMDLLIVRQVQDAYRNAVVRAAAGTLTGATTRLQDAQSVLDELAGKGLVGFTDKAGRRWGVVGYTEMATRTTTMQAAVQGHLDRLDQAGIPLVIVSDSSRECETCRPWEGKVLSRGPVSALMPNALTGVMERVKVDGTVAEATSAGLFHPNCTHNLSAYIPGATKRGAASSPEGYAEKQKQRQLERKVREWKRREAVAVTPEAKRKAAAKVREWQAAVKAHTDATGLPRKRNRESLTAAR